MNPENIGLPTPTPTPTPVYSAPPRRPKRASGEGLKSVLSTLAILIIAPIIALTLTTYVFQSYEVDGPSMETTLQNKDRLIVLKVPRTWAKITGNNFIPNRGDVVVFNYNENFSFGEQNRQLIKRVVGLPGDRVVVKDGVLTVYNSLNPEGFQPDRTLPYGSVIGQTNGDIDIRVEAGHVYVCGDNRDNSLDSRSFGPIKAEAIVGKLLFRVFPLNKADLF
jgi:signal peptidase I